MNYNKIYKEVCRKYKKLYPKATTKELRKKFYPDTYLEIHHIKAKCMGGSNYKRNLVALPARVHFVMHKLLVKMYPKVYKLAFALQYMATGKQKDGYKISSRDYEKIRIAHGKAHSISMSGENHWNYGKTFKHSNKAKNKISKGLMGKNNPMSYKKARINCSESLKKAMKRPEVVKKISENNAMKNKEVSSKFLGLKHPNSKKTNIYCYKTNKLVAKNICLSQWCKNKIYNSTSLYLTAKHIRNHHRNLYARYI